MARHYVVLVFSRPESREGPLYCAQPQAHHSIEQFPILKGNPERQRTIGAGSVTSACSLYVESSDSTYNAPMNCLGGVGGFFPDNDGDKPWSDVDHDAPLKFWEAKEQWYPTWKEGDSALQVTPYRSRYVSNGEGLPPPLAYEFRCTR